MRSQLLDRSRWVPLLVGLVLLTTWSATAALAAGLPTPQGTVTSLVGSLVDGTLAEQAFETFQSFAVGYGTALVVGFLAGTAIGSSAYLRAAIEPLAAVAYAVPKILLFPIFLVMFGIGPASAMALAFTSGIFPVLYYTMGGVRAMPPIYRRVSLTVGASLRQHLGKFVLPAIMPSFLVGARIAFAVTLVNVTVAELFGGTRGLGASLGQAYALGDLDQMLAIGVFLLIAGIVGSGLLNALGRVVGWEHRGTPEIVGGL